MGANNPVWRGSANIPLSKFHQWKRNAEVRDLSWEITIDDVEAQWVKQGGKCALTGVVLVIASTAHLTARKAPHEVLCSLDRIDASQGYTRDNIQLVSWAVNRIKNNLSNDAFRELCRQVINHEAIR